MAEPGPCPARLTVLAGPTAVGKGTVIAAAWSGKIKTACTMVGLIAMMAFTTSQVLDTVVTVVIVVTTVYSGIEYFVKNGKCLKLKG